MVGKAAFTDDKYQIFRFTDVIENRWHADDKELQKAAKVLLKEKSKRINGFEEFLSRHAIKVNPYDNDYEELSEFLSEHLVYSEDKSQNIFWYSLLIDLGLYIGESRIQKYPHFHWEIKGSSWAQGPLFIVNGKRMAGAVWTTLGIEEHQGIHQKKDQYGVVPLGKMITMGIDLELLGKDHPEFIRLNQLAPRRPRKEPFVDNEYTMRSDFSLYTAQDSLSPSEKRTGYERSLQAIEERNKEIAQFFARHSISIDPTENDYDSWDIFFSENIDPHPEKVLEYDEPSDLWLSIGLDVLFYVADSKIKQNPGFKWLITKGETPELVIHDTKGKRRMNFILYSVNNYVRWNAAIGVKKKTLQEVVYQYIEQRIN